MKEELFQFIWQYKLFDITKCTTLADGSSFMLLNTGEWNKTDGPDFVNARIKINNTTWAGAIELHIHASDWIKHKHAEDTNYDKIILHVVLLNDIVIKDKLGNELPTLVLKEAINANLLSNYQRLMHTTNPLACHAMWPAIKDITKIQQLEKMLIERLMQKASHVQDLLTETNNDWNEVFYITIAKGFGYPNNADAMAALAARIPLKILAKHKHNAIQLQAVLLGVAGLLPKTSTEEYTIKLINEYKLIKQKYNLQEMEPTRWKFLGTRPANFPTLRIVQLANLVMNSSHLLRY
jgi:hypothetical protein